MRQTIEDNRSHLEHGGVRLEAMLAGAPLFVNADGTRIAQVVMNLLSNAVNFTPAGGTATVSLSADHAGGHAVLRVADTGTGIEPALLERLFEPFRQADRTLDRASGGLGLGLALVKGMVELHGGEVSARSEGRDKGAEFVVRLPLDTGPVPEAGTADRGDVTAARRRILVIDDDPDVANGLRTALEIDGLEVEVARDSRDALDKARRFRPDVVLCDIGLPGVDGYDVARALRADEALRSTYLVALTGYAQTEDLERARAAGFDQHLAKPARLEKIRQVCAAHLGRPPR